MTLHSIRPTPPLDEARSSIKWGRTLEAWLRAREAGSTPVKQEIERAVLLIDDFKRRLSALLERGRA